jgi:chaperonin GroES
MSTPLHPLGDRIVAVKQEAQTKTASGFFLPDSAKEKSSVAVVEAVGPDVKHVKKGDQIVYKEYSINELKVDSKEYLIVKEEDVLATIV